MLSAITRATLAGRAVATVSGLPRPLLRALFGAPPPVAHELAPDAWALARLQRLVPEPSGDVARRRAAADAAGLPAARRLAPQVATSDHRVPGPIDSVTVRLYVPPAAAGGDGPLLVWVHGGGWVFRSLDTHDASLRFLAASAGVRIASVEYRLAPEHPFPAGLDDVLAAWRAVTADPGAFGAAPGRVAIGGDSAGGNLAAAVALAGRDGDVPAPSAQILLYPICDVPGSHPSYATFADGFGLAADAMRWYFRQYAGSDEAAWADPRIAILRARLEGLAPTHVATALADPLRDEGEALAAALAAAGVPVTSHRHPHLHGFLNLTAGAAARDAVAQLGGVARAML